MRVDVGWRASVLAGAGMLAWLGYGSPAGAAVGSTEANYGVTANGAPVYTIPIRVTEGTAGMTPRLAISWIGAGERSLLGMGFTIAGLSAITPCAKTVAADTTAGPVILLAGDRYCLDGARLRGVSGTYGASGATYRTEIDQLARVTSNNSVNNVPGWFKVETRDGLVYEYGNTADSLLRTSASASARTILWAVNKISDRAGNSITFSYDNDDAAHRFRPSLIRYTNRVPPDGHYTVEFLYQSTDRPDPFTWYTSSSGEAAYVYETRLLDKLLLKHDGVTYRQYVFSYNTGAGANSRLASVQECAATTSDCFPATSFSWINGTAGHGTLVNTSTPAPNALPLDLNGDGYEDLVWASGGTWRYLLGGASGYGTAVNTSVTATNPTKAMSLDWNADGREDLLIDWSDGYWRVLKGNATGFDAPVHAGPGAGTPSNTASSSWWVADITGDGRDDLLRIRTTTTQNLAIWVRVGTASGFASTEAVALNDPLHRPTVAPLGTFAERRRSIRRRADFNGDGREDLMVRACEWDGELSLCLWTGWFQVFAADGALTSVAYAASDATGTEPPMFGDFNGDHLTDFVYRGQYNGKWAVAASRGEGGYSLSYGASTTGYLSYLYLVGDYDGDGVDDLYVANTATGYWNVLRSGTALTPTTTTMSTAGGGWTVIDYNGDGLHDLGRWEPTSFYWKMHPHAGVPGDRLSFATDGFGNRVTFTYLPMSNTSVYTRGTGAAYPLQDFTSTAGLVRTMQVTPAGTSAYTFTYAYQQARRHVQGRGSVGMGQRTISDGRTDSVHTTEIYQQDFPYVGAVKTVTFKQSGNSKVIQTTTHTYDKHNLDLTTNNQRYLPYRKQTVTNTNEVGGILDGLPVSAVTESLTVSTLGNVTQLTVSTVDKDAGSSEYNQSYTTVVNSTYSEDQTYWCLALPVTRSESRTRPGGSSLTRSVAWTVSAPQCRITQETIEPLQPATISLVTDVGYDACGNVNSVSSYPAGSPTQARTTTLNFGSRCQRPETITNPLGHATTLGYDFALGVMTSHTDPNTLQTTFERDTFGRLTRRLNNADGTATRIALTQCTSSNSYCGKASDVRLKVSRTARDTANAVLRTDDAYFNGKGLERWRHSDTLDGAAALVETRYDAFERVSQRAQPYYSGGNVFWTSYLYDVIGRVTQENAPVKEATPTGRITSIAYEGRNVKVTDPLGITTTRTQNVLGELRSVVDPSPGGTTNYAYAPFGELASITDAAGNVSSWTYNLRGFVSTTNDPDAGARGLTPNAFGEVTSQTDANGRTVTFQYDKLSRLTKRIELEGTTDFTYGNDPGAWNIGQLASVTSPGAYAETYTFDNKGRPVQTQVTADGTTYSINQTYDLATGLPATLEYPLSTSSYRLKLSYEYAKQILKKVKDANSTTVFWEATSTDAWGHIQDETFGNGVRTFSDFDQANGWMEARQGGMGGGIGFINATASWDKNGNLIQRQDLKQSVTEEFWYDSLNRFDYSKRNGTINQDVTLNAIGNITWKLGIGNYTYHATKKRAVITAGSNSYGYDANGNMTSRNGSSITYTSYNLPSLINSSSNSSALSYGAFRNRYKQVAVTSGVTETTIYVAGLLEKVTKSGVTQYRHKIHGGNGVAAIYTRRTSGSPLISTYYVHTDHLGSPELITDVAGAQVVKLSFGAYGERRDSDWDGAVSSADQTTIGNTWRGGFTGHEHLDAVGLIHMNGRVYDPVVARFLSVDPLVRVGLSQSPNSYSYVRNNPATLVDPSGYLEGPRRGACGGVRCTEGRGDVGGGGWDPSPGPFDRFNPVIRVIPGCRQCTTHQNPGGGADDPDPDAAPSASMPMARPLAMFTGADLDRAVSILMHGYYEREEWIDLGNGILVPVLGRAYVGSDPTATEIYSKIQEFLEIVGTIASVAVPGDEVVLGAVLFSRVVSAARGANAADALARKMGALERAQAGAARTRTLPDGRTRYYSAETPARTPGATRGASLVTEHNPRTGQVRQWMESYDQAGNVTRVHPKMIDGQILNSPHYPPTGTELGP